TSAFTYPASGAGSVRPHAVTQVGSSVYSYDASGNMTTRAGATITFDARGHVTNVTGTSGTALSYDADGARIQKVYGTTTTRYLGDGLELNMSTGTWTKYVGGAKRVGPVNGPWTSYWIHTDQQGSIQSVTDSNGVEQLHRRYYPFGDKL